MEIHQIRYFVTAAELLNFTQAAARCNVSQPALTRAIKKLEEELGGSLFRREGRNTHLTELGRMVRPRLEQAFSLTQIARDEALDFTKMTSAKLDLGVMCTISPTSVMSLVEFFSQKVPQLKLMIHETTGQALTEKLVSGDLDVALLALPNLDDDLHAVPLFSEPFVITFPDKHRFAEMETVPLDELRGENYLRRINCEYLDILAAEGHEYHFGTDHRFQSEHESWVQALVIAGLGCAIMPKSLTHYPELRSRPLVDPAIHRTISVATRRGRRHTPVVDFFVKLCRQISWGDAAGAKSDTL